MRLLTFTSLYPDPVRPRHGIFVENRLRHLVASGKVVSRVVAPVPWFPSPHPVFGTYAKYARVPRRELRHGIEVLHPRYPLLPKVGMTMAPFLMAAVVKPAIRRLIAEGYDFDAIDAHYFYPDGIAAVWLGRCFNKPVVVTARGSDLHLIPKYPLPRRLIKSAAGAASGLITVCQALKDVLVDMGVPDFKVTVLRNGVDLALFRPPADRAALRARLGFVQEPVVLSVGNLIPLKGHDITIHAISRLSDARLLIAGDGPEKPKLEQLAQRLGVAHRVTFLGTVPHHRLVDLYGAADILVLASSREGWANVLLESMACGTPVVATRVWGTPEVVTAPEAGTLIDERTPEALYAGICRLLSQNIRRELTRAYAERFGWDETTQGQIDVFERVIAAHTA